MNPLTTIILVLIALGTGGLIVYLLIRTGKGLTDLPAPPPSPKERIAFLKETLERRKHEIDEMDPGLARDAANDALRRLRHRYKNDD